MTNIFRVLNILQLFHDRSSCPEVFCKKNFTKFTGKHLCQSLFFNKIWFCYSFETLEHLFLLHEMSYHSFETLEHLFLLHEMSY